MSKRLALFAFCGVALTAASAQDTSLLELPLPDPGSAPAAAFRLASLELESSEPNEITDTDGWWKRNGLQSPELYVRFPALERGRRPDGAPDTYKGLPLVAARRGGDRDFFLYGESPYKVRYLLAQALDVEEPEFAFDAKDYGTVAWAAIIGDTLYLTSTPGNLSAADGGGARLYAIDIPTASLRWKTEEKVAHGQFVVVGGSVICSYGFTGEPDFITVIDRGSGKVQQRLKTKTAAEWLIHKGDKLFVRCYNTDNVYRIRLAP